ncbi:MAG: AAA family ATPase [Gaiellaceae bacterium]
MTCTSCGAPNREEARFCDSCGAALAAEESREQRKVVTVLFCDVSGSTAFAESRDPEAVRAVMGRYFDVARSAIERHGGTLEKFIGDAVMAVFGVPTTREDDALRGVRAAQEIREAVEIDVRIGVNTGEVVTGSGDSLVTGDAVNVAARLEQAASPGEVLLGAGTYALVRDAVDVELLPPLDAKGKAQPLTAYRLQSVTGDAAFVRRLDAPLVGREREWRLLEDAWERCRSERACALFTILGAAGVGKSRLVAEFLGGIEATVVHGRCLSYGEGITYSSVIEVVKQLLGDAPPPDEALAALLGDGDAPADEIAFAVRKLLEQAAAERPLVVFFDDVQWGEPTFLDLIEHVSDWSRDVPMLIVCLARPDLLELRPSWGGGKLNATTVLLEPLTESETEELIGRLLGELELVPSLRDRIREAAGGNPLYVEQMLAMVHETGAADVIVPPTIQALLAARLDQLPPSERAALERGAVEGQVFHRGAVQALAPEETGVPGNLMRLVRKELVRPTAATLPGDDAFRFPHLLIRDAAYDALPKAARAQLHERFAQWIEMHAPDLVELDEILGYHLEQAARYRSELGTPDGTLRRRAAERLGKAGLRARAREDDHAAASLLARAVALLGDDDAARLELLTPLGQALHVLGRLDEAYRVLDDAIEHGGEEVSALAYFYKQFAAGHGESISAHELEPAVRARLEELGSDASPRALANGYAVLAQVLFWAGRLEAAGQAAERGLEFARVAGDDAAAKQAAGLLIGVWGHGDTPLEQLERNLVPPPAPGVDVRPVLVAVAGLQGRIAEARRIYDEYVEDLRARGQIVSAISLVMGIAWFEFLAGDVRDAETLLRQAWSDLGKLGERGFRSTIGALLADVLARQGKLDDAAAVVDEAEEISTPDDFVTMGQAASARAWICIGRGDHARAVELARRATEIADTSEFVSLRTDSWLEYGEVLLAAGRREEAKAALARARDLASRKGATLQVGRIDALLADEPATTRP